MTWLAKTKTPEMAAPSNAAVPASTGEDYHLLEILGV
jgi:hypothetical protein